MLVAGYFLLRDCGLHLRLIHKQKPKKKKELAIIQISTLGLFNTLYTESVLNFFFSKSPCSREEQSNRNIQ